MITFEPTKDVNFSKKITRENMSAYYKKQSIEWDDALFYQSWEEFENWGILSKGSLIGVLRIWSDSSACYIRDLQIKKHSQNQGIGSAAIKKAIQIAAEKGFALIRLRVFKENPAKILYERLGFKVTKEDENLFHMERPVS